MTRWLLALIVALAVGGALVACSQSTKKSQHTWTVKKSHKAPSHTTAHTRSHRSKSTHPHHAHPHGPHPHPSGGHHHHPHPHPHMSGPNGHHHPY